MLVCILTREGWEARRRGVSFPRWLYLRMQYMFQRTCCWFYTGSDGRSQSMGDPFATFPVLYGSNYIKFRNTDCSDSTNEDLLVRAEMEKHLTEPGA